jgi:FtsP/CotA-like multicopper oxidase with cupredoxin domain
MIIQPIDWFLAVWFTLAVASTAYVAYDQFRRNPEPAVMKWGFVLVTLYTGPLGLLLYVMADKEPLPGTHETFVQPLWKQGAGSTIHCLAGDATGIITAAVITALVGLPMWQDMIIEYIAGFLFGLLVFQALFMRKMMGGSYLQNVRRSFLPEFISMNAMMAGMLPVMGLLMMGRDMRAMQPDELLFWGVMSLGVIAGYAIAYPFNVWMVANQLKHGLMTERDGKIGGGRHKGMAMEGGGDQGMDMSAGAHKGMDMGTPRPTSKKAPMKKAKRKATAMPEMIHRGHSASAGTAMPATAFALTTPQLAAMTFISVLLLAVGSSIPAMHVNLTLSAKDVGPSIMPPGMTTNIRDIPAESMRDMAAVLPTLVRYTAPIDAQGDRELEYKLEGGVKVFDLETSVVTWHILPYVPVQAFAFNRQVPGPRIHVTEGDRIRIRVHNALPEPTTVHWHGLILPNAMDGPANITQDPIAPGDTFTYEFTTQQAGTYFYHTHAHADRQQALGLYGALIIDPKDALREPKADLEYTLQLQEWLTREGLTYPAMLMDGALPNFFTINGKSYPSTDTIKMKVGQTVKLRFIGSNNNFIHPMHVHGGPFTVVARDGEVLAETARFQSDTINVGPGQRYDVLWKARVPGKWLVHCHIPHHTTNNNVEEKGGGGLVMLIDVAT